MRWGCKSKTPDAGGFGNTLQLLSPGSTCLLHHQLGLALLQALRWDPGNSQLEADLEEVQQCMRPLDAATLRQAGQRRFKLKARKLPARPTSKADRRPNSAAA